MKTKTAMKSWGKCHHNTDEDKKAIKSWGKCHHNADEDKNSDEELGKVSSSKLVLMKQRKSTIKFNTALIF
ncbi:hypothetical protein J2Y03_002796 [Neobacillus niacini]|uniref:hypothetical protein n=1 Tax=Neobacillus niacini TaxID=86668 RepID=UPI0028606296|nr:hypothetical protein [Neobacillus niacini]MDR7077770.1 hypothetical protein [Neobacillus niacini]